MGQTNFTHRVGNYTLKLKSGNYRIYDENGQEVWKSDGKTNRDKQDAFDRLNQLTSPSPSKPFSPNRDVDQTLSEALEKTKEVRDNQQGLTEERAEEIDKKITFLQTIYSTSIREKKHPQEILNRWIDNPETMPQELKDLGLDDRMLTFLYSKVQSNTSKDQILDTIEEFQNQRNQAFGEVAKDDLKRKYAQQDEKERITDPETGVPSLAKEFEGLDPSTQETITPNDLRYQVIEKDADAYNKTMKETGDFIKDAFPDSWKLNWNEAPTRENAVKLHEELIKPGYIYNSSRPFDRNEHQLAASGHGKGSSTLQDNEFWKGKANTREDLENIGLIQNQLNTSFLSETEKINQINQMSQAMSNALGIPIQEAQKRLNDYMETTGNQEYRDKVFNRETAAMGMNKATQDMNENIQGVQLSEELNQAQQQEMQQLADQTFQFQMMAQDIAAGKAVNEQQYAMAKEEMWQNRQKLILMLKAEGRAEEAWELQKSQNDKDQFLNILGTLGKIGLSAALVGSNPAAAAAVWAPSVANFMGGSSQQGNNTTSQQGGAG